MNSKRSEQKPRAEDIGRDGLNAQEGESTMHNVERGSGNDGLNAGACGHDKAATEHGTPSLVEQIVKRFNADCGYECIELDESGKIMCISGDAQTIVDLCAEMLMGFAYGGTCLGLLYHNLLVPSGGDVSHAAQAQIALNLLTTTVGDRADYDADNNLREISDFLEKLVLLLSKAELEELLEHL
jgi:hypothetical protein